MRALLANDPRGQFAQGAERTLQSGQRAGTVATPGAAKIPPDRFFTLEFAEAELPIHDARPAMIGRDRK